MDNNPNRDRHDRSPHSHHADSGDHEADDQPEQPDTGVAVPESSTAVSRTASEMPSPPPPPPAAAATRRLQSEVGGGGGGGEGSVQRSRGPKRSRAAEEGAGPKPRKKPQEFDAPPVASPCSVCGRRFGSWKALFGHMRSHPDRDWRGIHPPPKFTRESTPEDDQEVHVIREQAENLLIGVAEEVAARLGKAPPGVSASPVPTTTVDERGKRRMEIEHKCSICSQVFSSGPALGGHMRSHSDRQFQAAAESSSSASRRRGLGIDLNMPNEPEDDESPRRPSSPPPEGKEGGFDLNRRATPPSDEE